MLIENFILLVVQLLIRVWLCDPMDCSKSDFPSFTIAQGFAQTSWHWLSAGLVKYLTCINSFDAYKNSWD